MDGKMPSARWLFACLLGGGGKGSAPAAEGCMGDKNVRPSGAATFLSLMKNNCEAAFPCWLS